MNPSYILFAISAAIALVGVYAMVRIARDFRVIKDDEESSC